MVRAEDVWETASITRRQLPPRHETITCESHASAHDGPHPAQAPQHPRAVRKSPPRARIRQVPHRGPPSGAERTRGAKGPGDEGLAAAGRAAVMGR